jgi:SUKH-3 immunity protein
MNDFPAEVQDALLAAGWRPGRRLDVAEWRTRLADSNFQMHDAAEKFLAEFGGLSFEFAGAGITRAREPFEFDPMLAWGEDDRFSDWSRIAKRSLFPVGELDRGRFFLGIDEYQAVYLVADWLGGYGFARDAIRNLILGVAAEVIYTEYP